MGESDTKTAQPRKAITPGEVQQKEFRVSRFGGYKMRDVDEFLDLITDTLSAMVAEIERLRSLQGSPAQAGAPDMSEASRQADEIVARARAEAQEMLDAARSEASQIASDATSQNTAKVSAERAALGALLTNERVFLQNLAALIQGHAESVKELARSARSAAPTPASADSRDAVEAPVPPAPASEGRPDLVIGEPDGEEGSSHMVVVGGQVADESVEPPAPVKLDEPEPASVGTTDEPEPSQDRSLRDLFWGED